MSNTTPTPTADILYVSVRMQKGECGAVTVEPQFYDKEGKLQHTMTEAMYVPFAGAMGLRELLQTADSVSDADMAMAKYFFDRRGAQHNQVKGWLSFVVNESDVAYLKAYPEWLEEVLCCFAHKTLVTVMVCFEDCEDEKHVQYQFRKALGRFKNKSGFIKMPSGKS